MTLLAHTEKMTLQTLRQMRAERLPIAVLTCYDFSTARVLGEAGIPVLLVGDSAAMVILGESSTTAVSSDFLVPLTKAVRRGAPQALVMADLPWSDAQSVPAALAACRRFLHEAGADIVKVEVGDNDLPMVKALIDAGIPVCGHLGLLPQRAAQSGGFLAQGRTPEEAGRIVNAAVSLARLGVSMLLLEAVPDEVSAAIHEQIAGIGEIPIIGCGAGPSCDGHVIVLQDMMGFSDRVARFVEVYGDGPAAFRQAAKAYLSAVESRAYPAPRHVYGMRRDTTPQE